MPRLQNIDENGYFEYDGPQYELRVLVGSALDETDGLPEFTGVRDERADQVV